MNWRLSGVCQTNTTRSRRRPSTEPTPSLLRNTLSAHTHTQTERRHNHKLDKVWVCDCGGVASLPVNRLLNAPLRNSVATQHSHCYAGRLSLWYSYMHIQYCQTITHSEYGIDTQSWLTAFWCGGTEWAAWGRSTVNVAQLQYSRLIVWFLWHFALL